MVELKGEVFEPTKIFRFYPLPEGQRATVFRPGRTMLELKRRNSAPLYF